jgi:hypothetical protein
MGQLKQRNGTPQAEAVHYAVLAPNVFWLGLFLVGLTGRAAST